MAGRASASVPTPAVAAAAAAAATAGVSPESESPVSALSRSLSGTSAAAPGDSLTLAQRAASASVGALLTSLLVTPLDVVKTRLQAQTEQFECIEARSPATCTRCTHYQFHNGVIDVMLPKSASPRTFECPEHFAGTLDALYKIPKYEGVGALYNGLRPSLIMAVPSTVLYFSAYDYLRLKLADRFGHEQTLAPLVAGTTARTLAATVNAPLELVRTQMQAVNNPPSTFRLAAAQVRTHGFRSLWQGLSPTLFRDVPFSALYWVIVEACKPVFRPYIIECRAQTGAEAGGSVEEFAVSFLAGATAGVVAATITHPFDVIKTRRQVFNFSPDMPADVVTSESSATAITRRIYKTDGPAGFLVGLAPRLGKIAPACAIMLSTYEAGKTYFNEPEH